MNKKPGFQVKLGGEEFLYTIIILLVFAFIFFMPDIHKLISKIKMGNIFKNDSLAIVNPVKPDVEIENNKVNNDSETILVCSKIDSIVDGNLTDTFTFYYDNNKLVKIINNKNYDAITDEYLNNINNAYSVFEGMKQQYENIPGFSYSSTFEDRMLNATFSYDLKILNLESLHSEEKDLNIELYVDADNNLNEVKTIYQNMKFNCR